MPSKLVAVSFILWWCFSETLCSHSDKIHKAVLGRNIYSGLRWPGSLGFRSVVRQKFTGGETPDGRKSLSAHLMAAKEQRLSLRAGRPLALPTSSGLQPEG